MTVNLVGGTKNAVLALGGLAGAIVAIVTVVGMVLPKGPAPKPAVEASFPEAKVEPGIVLAQYEYNNQPASATNAADRTGATIRYTLVADTGASTSTNEEPGIVTQTTGTQTIKETPEEIEAKLRKEKEEKLAREKALEEEVRKREALKAKEAAKKLKEENEAKEEAALKREQEAEENKVSHLKKGKATPRTPSGTDNAGTSPETKTSTEPTAPAKSFHKQGAAKVAIGTGAPPEQIEAVLRRAKAILLARAATLSHAGARANAAFEGGGQGFGDTAESDLAPSPPGRALVTDSESAEAQTLAGSVPSHCGAGCALAPTVDKALADYSSNLAQAARVVASAFRESRVELYEAKPQPVGVTVDYTIHFVGYEGQLMKLEWTLDESGKPLPKTWWRKVVVKQIVPTGESVGVSGNFWAPEPPRRGDYYFSLRVVDGSAEPTHKATELFH